MTYLLGVFLLYAFGMHIPVPGINHEGPGKHVRPPTRCSACGTCLPGGSLRRFSIFALGIMPYINASIIFQLLTVVLPKLEELAKEGETGQKQIAQWTRYLTIILGFVQAIGMYVMLNQMGAIENTGILSAVVIITTLVGGTAFLMWLGEEVSQKGIGNGVSLIIFIGIVASLPAQVGQTALIVRDYSRYGAAIVLTLVSIATVAFIILIHKGERKIPGPIRQARGGPQGVRRADHVYPAQSQLGRRYSHHLRRIHSHVPGHARTVHPAPHGAGVGGQVQQHVDLQHIVLPARVHLHFLLYGRGVQSQGSGLNA